MRMLETITLGEAKLIAAAAAEKAASQAWPVVIAILDSGGHLLYLERADDAQLGSVIVAQEKARTALLFRRPTKALQDRVVEGRTNMLALPGATPIEGGLPLMHQGQLVGSIGVSGVQSHEDAIIASAGVDALHAALHDRNRVALAE